MARSVPPLKDRIIANSLTDSNDCWIWQRRIQDNGYGQMSVDGKNSVAHRFSYIAFKGLIPEGLQIDHLCKVRSCVNPEHLEAVTPQENVHRSNALWKQEAARTHCKYGHEFTVDNIYKSSRGNGRNCKTCMIERTRNRYATKKLALGVA